MALRKSFSIFGMYIFSICKIKGLIRASISQSDKTMDCQLSKFSSRDYRSEKKKEGGEGIETES